LAVGLVLALASAAGAQSPAPADRETVFWQSVQNSHDPAEF
jgi:hypothetical protein